MIYIVGSNCYYIIYIVGYNCYLKKNQNVGSNCYNIIYIVGSTAIILSISEDLTAIILSIS